MANTTEHPLFVCHCLVGPPGSGKSTLAQQWVARSPHYQWISTDHIREMLYGDAHIQGNWAEIEAEVIAQIRDAIAQHRPVIYDATNAKRRWRLELMQKLTDGKTQWMAWWLKTSLANCKQHNRERSRQVEHAVIERMYQDIRAMPPIPAEGFAAVNPVPVADKLGGEQPFDLAAIEHKIQALPHSLMQRQRRQGQCQLHPYSSLLAFERLLYLMAILLAFPGAGSLRSQAADQLKNALQQETLPPFENSVAELSALITCRYGSLYAEPDAIAQNLAWLQANHLVNASYSDHPIELAEITASPNFPLHRYSDRDVFRRLISTFRFIAYHPFLHMPGKGSLKTLVSAMESQGVIPVGYGDSVRRDIGEILKPYDLMPKTVQTQGYFVGTAILSKSDLLRIFDGLAGQVHHLNDPMLLATHNTFRDRLAFLQPDLSSSKPVRSVLQQPIVDIHQLPAHTISLAAPGNAERLEAAIRNGQILTLKRRRGTGRFGGEQEATFGVLPLQIVFHNIAWYLGYRQVSDGLLRFERLDRLELFEIGSQTQSKALQSKALQQLMKLYEASYGLHLGDSASEQRAFLSADPKRRSQIEVVCELWFTDAMFRFVSEGSQRFPGRQKMSPRLTGSVMTQAEKKMIFCLKKTGDRRFPNRLQVHLPRWVIDRDVDFKRWLLGFGGQIKVISPQCLADHIQKCGQDICQAYQKSDQNS